jgi:hypothetical protein
MRMKPLICTSIPPTLHRRVGDRECGDAYQQACINSWRQAGFQIVSMNADSEIELLRSKLGDDVHFVSNGSGEAHTRIHALLSFIRSTDVEVAGIINADCYLISETGVVGGLIEAATNSIVLLERLNLSSETMCPTGVYCGGFDAFFFDTRFLAQVTDAEDWKIGKPHWDYWFPLAMRLAGATLRMGEPDILLHLDHEPRWCLDEYMTNARALRQGLMKVDLEQLLSLAEAAEFRSYGSRLGGGDNSVHEFANFISSWLIVSARAGRLEMPPNDAEPRVLAEPGRRFRPELERALGAIALALGLPVSPHGRRS